MFRRIVALLPVLVLSFATLTASAQTVEEGDRMQLRPTAETSTLDRNDDGYAPAECSITCPGGSSAQTRGDQCTCEGVDVDDIQETASPCTAQGCASACAPNQCVGWRGNSSGGCNYSCLMNTRAPDRTVTE